MRKSSSEPWHVHFFRRHKGDDPSEAVPAVDFLDQVPAKVAAQFHAVLEAVAAAPPPSFSGGGKWEVMGGDMAGFFEVRIQHGPTNHRLFCILQRDAADLGGSSIVCIGGLSKPRGTAARPQDYKLIKQYRDEFDRRRRVLS